MSKYTSAISVFFLAYLLRSSLLKLARGVYLYVRRQVFKTLLRITGPESPVPPWTKCVFFKYGSRTEADAQRFVRAHTSVPVPKVFDSWTDYEGRHVIAMERVAGDTAFDLWGRVTKHQRRSIILQLAKHIREWRTIPHPRPGHVEALDGGSMTDSHFWIYRTFGPFDSLRAFHDWRTTSLQTRFANNNDMVRRLDEIRSDLRDDHAIVFTHGDVALRNVMVDVRGDGPDDIIITGIIDWELAGWMPEYWEFIKCGHASSDSPVWLQMAQRMLPGYDAEFALDDEMLDMMGAPK